MGAAVTFLRKSKGLMLRNFDIPPEAAKIIARNSPVYGSHGTAILVATEILIRQKKPIRVRYRKKRNGTTKSVSYKLMPRAVQLINELTPIYGRRGGVIEACAAALDKKRYAKLPK